MWLSKVVNERVAQITLKSAAIVIDLALLLVAMALVIEWPDVMSMIILAATVAFSSINIWTLLLSDESKTKSTARKTSLVINVLLTLGAAAFAIGSFDYGMISHLEGAAIFILLMPPVINWLAIYISRRSVAELMQTHAQS